ncbi:outer membrane beta-barrel protein [Glaciecola sp. KUL10]|uniref:outer membrane beta-barrel protein n=1 Tax=Glaciecola sp. (strain KUL10) TaxID=2161813 RepID=UPI000D7839D2|nr:outer membrane beta-barrel protein [Glaciecola sp. KUL10]GBL04868.1 hypothetical protein KUL10_21830 [Glaciecola sp. KUL10]
MKLWKVAALSTAVVTAMNAQAQQFDDAAPIAFGSFDFIPTVDVGLRYDDNVTRQNEDKISSFSSIISPQFVLLNNFGASQTRFGYRLRNERFFSSNADNYTDHFLSVGVEYELNIRHRLDVSFDFEDGHEQRGTGFSILNLGETPDTYKKSDLGFQYSYGAPGATGRVDLGFDISDRNYDLQTDEGLARDRVVSTTRAGFFYKIGTATDATFDVILRNVAYGFELDANNPLDSSVASYLIGVQWEATAETSGFVKLGYEEKDFDSSLREDYNGFDWSAGVTWEPTSNSQFRFITSNDTNESNGEGNFIRQRDYTLQWNHQWLERLRTRASFTLSTDRYEGQPTEFGAREDDLERLNLTAYYQFRRWFNVEVGYVFDTRDSNRSEINYDRNQFLINAYITL